MVPTAQVLDRLARTKVIDITTVGCRSGQPRRIEIWWFRVQGRFVITGTPGRRAWLANLRADPTIIVHTPFGDFPGQAAEVADEAQRRRLFADPQLSWYREQTGLDRLVAESPMVEIMLR